MKTFKTWKDAAGYNIEVYEGDKLIEWRCGLTKSGLANAKRRFLIEYFRPLNTAIANTTYSTTKIQATN